MDLRLKDILRQKGLTIKELALITNISASNLSNYINGNISPTLKTLERIAKGLNIDVEELFKPQKNIEIYAKYEGKLYPIKGVEVISIKKEDDE